MTEPEDQVVTDDTTTDTENQVTDEQRDDSPNREAAKYRRQLRDTEARLNATLERLTRHERDQAERIAGQRLDVGADLFDIGGVSLDNLRNDEGEIDQEKVLAAADDLAGKRPRLRKPSVSFDGGVHGTPSGNGPTYAGVLQRSRQ